MKVQRKLSMRDSMIDFVLLKAKRIRSNFWIIAVAVVSILPWFAHHQAAQHPEKQQPKIGVRNAHAMVYDGRRGRAILFGGADDSRVCSDTWEWNGDRWTRVSVTGPGPRTFPSMAYDTYRRRVVLFGGNKVLFGASEEENKFLDDTWEWADRKWTQIHVSGPPGRAEAAMGFDHRRGRVVLFGGYYRSNGKITRLGDTWEWDGSRWVELKVPGPAPRSSSALAYDSTRARIVLFGGRTQEGLSGETWEWDGRQWIENRSALTEGRFNSVMAYDEARHKMIRFGGRFAGKPVGDTWEYDGHKWTRLDLIGPAPRNHTAMVYDPRLRRIVLFGGHDFGTSEVSNIFGDTWEWDPAGWVLKDVGETRRRIENGH